MNARTASRLAWSLWGAALTLLLVNLVLSIAADALAENGVFVFGVSDLPLRVLDRRRADRRTPAGQRDRMGVHRNRDRLGGAGAADAYAAYALSTGTKSRWRRGPPIWAHIWFFGPLFLLPVTLPPSSCSRTGGCRHHDGDRSSGSRSWGYVAVLLANAFDP